VRLVWRVHLVLIWRRWRKYFTGSNLTELSRAMVEQTFAESCYIMESHFFGRNVFKMKAGERME
jgi:hypothetical protein